jgi:hypothetical protein
MRSGSDGNNSYSSLGGILNLEVSRKTPATSITSGLPSVRWGSIDPTVMRYGKGSRSIALMRS